MTFPSRLIALFVAMGTLTTAACADDDDIVTDRPDFSESSEVVGRGRWQIEAGVQWERARDGGVRTRLLNTPVLLRFGVSESLELRLESDGYARRAETDAAAGMLQRQHGFNDLSVGVKWQVQEGDESAGQASVAWLLHADVDSGSRAFRGQGVRPSLRVVGEWELPERFSIGVMPGIVADRRADGHRFAAGLLAVTLGKEFTSAWRGFVEVAAEQLAARRNGGSVVVLDGGAAWLVAPLTQIDFSVTRGVSSAAPDWRWGSGISMRF